MRRIESAERKEEKEEGRPPSFHSLFLTSFSLFSFFSTQGLICSFKEIFNPLLPIAQITHQIRSNSILNIIPLANYF